MQIRAIRFISIQMYLKQWTRCIPRVPRREPRLSQLSNTIKINTFFISSVLSSDFGGNEITRKRLTADASTAAFAAAALSNIKKKKTKKKIIGINTDVYVL